MSGQGELTKARFWGLTTHKATTTQRALHKAGDLDHIRCGPRQRTPHNRNLTTSTHKGRGPHNRTSQRDLTTVRTVAKLSPPHKSAPHKIRQHEAPLRRGGTYLKETAHKMEGGERTSQGEELERTGGKGNS